LFGGGHRRDDLLSGFIQDEVRLTDSVSLTMGVKLEHNAYTGFEYEPGVQLAWSPTKSQTFWASASRAIQQPSWLYADAQLDAAAVPLGGGAFGIVQISGNPRGRAPVLFNYELGYRAELSKRLTLDATVFLGDYDLLQTIDAEAPFFTAGPPPHLVLPSVYGSLGSATNYGAEVSAHWDVAKWWRISPGFSFLQMNLSLAPGGNSTNDTYAMISGDSPKWEGQLRSNIRLPHNVEWDTSAYYVGPLHTPTGALSGPVPAYTRLDIRLGWHIGENAEIGITGQNLLTPRHLEFLDALQVAPTEAARAIVARITWHF
jgi:iron complex outermembrane recepter protein